jgi:hypothetical protein
MPVPSGFGRRTVDYLVCADGLFLAIEAKRPDGVLTEHQKGTLEDIRKAGGWTFVVNDDDSLDAFEQFLQAIVKWGGEPLELRVPNEKSEPPDE